MKKMLILTLSAIAIQSYAAVQWNCTSPDIKQSYLPTGCTGVSGNTESTTPQTTTKAVDLSSCVSSDKDTARRCIEEMSIFNTNGIVIVSSGATCSSSSNKCLPYATLQNSDGTNVSIYTKQDSYSSFSNYSEIPANAAICSRWSSSAPLSNCPSGTYAMTFKDGDPDKLVLVP